MWNQKTLNSFDLKSAEKVLAKIKSGKLEMIPYIGENLKDDTFIIFESNAQYYWMHIDREGESAPTIIMHYIQSTMHPNAQGDHSNWIGPLSYTIKNAGAKRFSGAMIYNLLPLTSSFLNWRENPFQVKA